MPLMEASFRGVAKSVISKCQGTLAVGAPQLCTTAVSVHVQKIHCPAEIVEKEMIAEIHSIQITRMNQEKWRH